MTPQPYKVLVVDDEPLIQTMTRSALRRFQFANTGIELISAESGAAAQEVVLQHSDISIILLDVVMDNRNLPAIATSSCAQVRPDNF
jgi:CheY-like chemotaxis protein